MTLTNGQKPAEARADDEVVVRPKVRIVEEPLTYQARVIRNSRGGVRVVSPDGHRSYFRDLAMHLTHRGEYPDAEARLQKHGQEMKVIGESRGARILPGVEYAAMEQRTVSWTNGSGGYFAPPLWLVEQFATTPTPERVLSARIPTFDLPEGVQSINIPRWVSGGEMYQTGLNQPSGSPSIADFDVASPVTTFAGTEDVPLQMLEQSPVGAHFDWVTFTNMEARYGYKLELQLINGAGATNPQGSGNNQLLGILNNTAIPTANQVTYTSATPKVSELIQSSTTTQGGPLAQAIAAIGNNRFLSPECWLMTTSRGAWVASGVVGFAIAVMDQPDPGIFDLLTYPVYPNNAIPANLNGNQDTIIACRPSDWILLEGEARTNVFTDVVSGTLMARIQMHRYAAAVLRQPSSVAYLTGTGMIVQPNF